MIGDPNGELSATVSGSDDTLTYDPYPATSTR